MVNALIPPFYPRGLDKLLNLLYNGSAILPAGGILQEKSPARPKMEFVRPHDLQLLQVEHVFLALIAPTYR